MLDRPDETARLLETMACRAFAPAFDGLWRQDKRGACAETRRPLMRLAALGTFSPASGEKERSAHHHHGRADADAAVEIDHVLIEHADAAVGDEAADR